MAAAPVLDDAAADEKAPAYAGAFYNVKYKRFIKTNTGGVR